MVFRRTANQIVEPATARCRFSVFHTERVLVALPPRTLPVTIARRGTISETLAEQTVMMKAPLLIAVATVSGSLCAAAELPRGSPEAQGVASAAVLAFVEAADRDIDSLHSFMLVRHGQVVAEGWWTPYDAQSRHSLFSLSKSFTSTAVGLAIDEGKLSLNGAFGQFCIVLPEQDAVVAITSGVRDMQSVLNLVWDKLLPALQPSALPADDQAAGKLAGRLKKLSLRTPQAAGSPPAMDGKKHAFPPNERKLEAISLASNGAGVVTLVARIDGNERRIDCVGGEWRKGRIAWGRAPEQPAAASGAWTSDDTFTAKICSYETPFTTTVRLKFAGDEVRCASESNVGFGPAREAELVGRIETEGR